MRKTVAKISDFDAKAMVLAKVGDVKVLLSRVDGEIYATGATCPHNGASLDKGVLCDRRVVCPWHNASFDVTTGEQLCPPGLDGLPSYPVTLEGDDIVVELPEEPQKAQTPKMARHNPETESRTFAILGAGAAGLNAAETLRSQGFEGKVVLITAEDELPYDRTALSKQYLAGGASEDSLSLRSPEFYQHHDIALKTGARVTQVSPQSRQLTFDNGETLDYDALLLATGGIAKMPPIDGVDLNGVFKLHNHQQAEAILQAAQTAKQAVVVGSSFIGMETAASLAQQDVAVTVLSPDEVPFKRILGPEVGKLFQRVHEAHGVTFKLGEKLEQVNGNGSAASVTTNGGSKIPADLVVIGIGVQPATDYLQEVALADDNSVPVDAYLQAGEGLYAAGDIATYPNWRSGERVRIEHWQLAAQQGRAAARNMLGQQQPFRGVPFFWTGQFNLKLRYVGHSEDWDTVIIDGNVTDSENPEFLAFYCEGDRVAAVSGINRDADIAMISELMRRDEMPVATAVKGVDWQSKC